MMISEQEFLSFMDAQGFTYQRIEHPAVFTCAEADLYHSGVTAVSTKNLFLCDKKGRRFFLAVTACEKNVDLNNLSSQLGVSRLRFGSEENLLRLLGVTRGSVTMMTVEPGDVFGWSALITPYRATSSVISLEPVRVVAFDAGLLRERVRSDCELTAGIYPKLLEALARRLDATRHQLLDLYGSEQTEPW
jgi:CRP-like cAMP-binding protein